MPAGVIERVFAAEMGPEIVNFEGGSVPEKRQEAERSAAPNRMHNRCALVAAARCNARPKSSRARSKRPSTWRQSLEGRQALGDLVEGLLVDRENRHPWAAEKAWIVKRADFQDHGRQIRSPGR